MAPTCGARKSIKRRIFSHTTLYPDAKLLIAGANGLGKRSEFSEYRTQSRGGSGIIAIKSDKVAGALSVTDEDEVMMFTLKGQAVRSPIEDVRITGRAASGVKLVNLGEKDELIGISKVIASEEDASEENEELADADVPESMDD